MPQHVHWPCMVTNSSLLPLNRTYQMRPLQLLGSVLGPSAPTYAVAVSEVPLLARAPRQGVAPKQPKPSHAQRGDIYKRMVMMQHA